MQKKWLLYSLAAVMAIAMACGGDSKTPTSPSTTASSPGSPLAAAADGSTLKVTAPTLSAPAEGATADGLTPNLVILNSTARYQTDYVPPYYRFVVMDSANAEIYNSGQVGAGASLTGHRVPTNVLKADTSYKWKARAEGATSNSVGPYSTVFTFKTPANAGGLPSYQTATTLWDNLTDGKTIGRATNMEFIATKGARTIGFESFIQYPLRQTLTQGEMSFYVDNFNPLAAGGKTKFSSMSSDAADVTTDPWRFTLEKRGTSYVSPGQVRWRIITGDNTNRVYDGGPWQPVLDKTKTHFIKYTWGNGRVTLLIAEADAVTGVLGTVRLNVSAAYGGTYRPNPHMAYIGAEPGRAGVEDASVPNMTVRYVWVSDGLTPRPGMRAADLLVGDGPGY
jgi:hypothetical protein